MAKTEIEKYFDEQWGKGILFKASTNRKPKYHKDLYLSSGSHQLNNILSDHPLYGMRRGRLMEIFGPESTGKTTIALHFAAEATKRKMTVGFMDVEHALDLDYVEKIGVDLDRFYIAQPECCEDCFEVAFDLLSRKINLLVFDSVPSMIPKAIIDGEMLDQEMGTAARVMGKGVKKLSKEIAKADAWGIFINQIRFKIGVTFGNPETTPGGMALRFYTSYRLDLRMPREGKIEETVKKPTLEDLDFDEDEKGKKKKSTKTETGSRIVVKAIKNKLARPYQKASIKIDYGKGIDKQDSLLQYLAGKGIVNIKDKRRLSFGKQDFTRDKFFADEKAMAEVDKILEGA